MFSALRRHFHSTGSAAGSSTTSPRPTPLPSTLQEKFQRGITANIRIIICGKKKSGKSALLNRLSGKPHVIDYFPSTEAVKAATVNWNYKSTAEITKVDAWEIQEGKEYEHFAKTNGIIYMYNCLDSFELDIILDIIEKSVPTSKSVLIVANFSDMDEYVIVDPSHIEKVRLASENRETPIYYCKSSMASGRGLSMIYKFINIPYLRLRRKQLEESLNDVNRDIELSDAEMILVENNQNGKPVPTDSIATTRSGTHPQNGSKNGSENELVIQSDDEISITSLNDQLFNKKQRNVVGGSEEEEVVVSISVASEPEESESETFDPDKRRTPLGKSPDIASDIAKGSPDLRAPLAIPDSPFSSTIGDSSVLSSLYTNQSSPGSGSEGGSRRYSYNLNHTSSSINNFLVMRESSSFESGF